MSVQETRIELLKTSDQFQELYDQVAELFEAPVWSRYITPQFSLSLEWKAILAVLSNTPAASIIDFSSGKPLQSRPTLARLNGELVTLGNKWQMSKKDVREFYELQDKVGQLGITPSRLIDFLYPDMSRAALGPHKMIDMLLLQAMSTGSMKITGALNPLGISGFSLDWGVTQRNVSTVWSDPAAKPLDDIRATMDYGRTKGVRYNIMKMSRSTFNSMMATDQIRDNIKAILSGLEVNAVGSILPVQSFNNLLTTLELPIIEIMEDPITIQDGEGTESTVYPFVNNRVTFSVDNNFGELYYTYANEQRNPALNKSYAVVNDVLISRWVDDDGNEITSNELNAFPVINVAKQIVILKTDTTS